jgi:hypothetical protein
LAIGTQLDDLQIIEEMLGMRLVIFMLGEAHPPDDRKAAVEAI